MIYESSLYLLREELYRTHGELAMAHAAVATEFFASLPLHGVVLDYGCGTAEYGRMHWYDTGGRVHFGDASQLLKWYLESKYAGYSELIYIDVMEEDLSGYAGFYNGILCLDVLEHLPNPMVITENLHWLLKPSGQALFFFCAQRNISGHLDESIDQYPEWLNWMHDHFTIVKEVHGLLWVQKP